MADKGIIFSAPMVRALLEGRKTQTRRLLSSVRVFGTPERPAFSLKGAELNRALQGADRWRHLDGNGWFWEADAFDYQAPATRTGWMANLPYAPGDRLYVRENFQLLRFGDYEVTKAQPADVRFAATDTLTDCDKDVRGYPWRPCIHMPRWASRLWLEVTDVRVQRLQAISDADAIAEGIQIGEPLIGESPSAARLFKHLWNSLHGSAGERWQDNPWIVAVSFEVHHGNIDGVGDR